MNARIITSPPVLYANFSYVQGRPQSLWLWQAQWKIGAGTVPPSRQGQVQRFQFICIPHLPHFKQKAQLMQRKSASAY